MPCYESDQAEESCLPNIVITWAANSVETRTRMWLASPPGPGQPRPALSLTRTAAAARRRPSCHGGPAARRRLATWQVTAAMAAARASGGRGPGPGCTVHGARRRRASSRGRPGRARRRARAATVTPVHGQYSLRPAWSHLARLARGHGTGRSSLHLELQVESVGRPVRPCARACPGTVRLTRRTHRLSEPEPSSVRLGVCRTRTPSQAESDEALAFLIIPNYYFKYSQVFSIVLNYFIHLIYIHYSQSHKLF